MGRSIVEVAGGRRLRRPFPARSRDVGVVDAGEWSLGIVAGMVALFILLLMAIVVWMSTLPGLPGDPGFTVENYTDVFEDGVIFDALINSFLIGIGTVAVNILFAVPLAWLVHRTDMPGKSLVVTLVAISILIPGFLKAMGWILMLSPDIGLLNSVYAEITGAAEAPFTIYGIGGVVFIQGLMLTPAMFFLISGSMIALDPALEEAAQMSGASRWLTILRVSFPLIRPAVIAGLIYNFMTAVTLYEIAALLLDEDTAALSTELFLYVRSAGGSIELGYAAVYGVIMMGFAIFALWFYGRAIRKAHRFAVVTGKGYRPKLVALGRWHWAAIGFVLFYVALSELLPLTMLVWISLLPALTQFSVSALGKLSFATYGSLWGQLGGWEPLVNTIVMITATPVLVVGLSLVMSYVTVRSRLPGRQLIDTAAMLPHVIPGIAFAFALFVFGIALSRFTGIQLSGTMAMIVAALVVYRIPYCTRVTNAALLQIHAEIEEAARMCGANTIQILLRIAVPLIKSSLAYAALWIALLMLREVTIPLMLASPSNIVLSVRIWTLWETGQYGVASALGVVMFTVSGAVLLIVQRLFRAQGLFETRGN